jgi:hypothetical protein
MHCFVFYLLNGPSPGTSSSVIHFHAFHLRIGYDDYSVGMVLKVLITFDNNVSVTSMKITVHLA